MMTRHYRVAGHTFAISVREELFALIGNYEPFACDGGEPLFTLIEDSGAVPEYTEVYRKEGLPYIYGRTASGNNVYGFMESRNSGMCLICSKDNREGRLIMMGGYLKEKLNRSLMIMYALATAGKDTLCIHAAVVSCEGKGYLFLGSRGTGKARTHDYGWSM